METITVLLLIYAVAATIYIKNDLTGSGPSFAVNDPEGAAYEAVII